MNGVSYITIILDHISLGLFFSVHSGYSPRKRCWHFPAQETVNGVSRTNITLGFRFRSVMWDSYMCPVNGVWEMKSSCLQKLSYGLRQMNWSETSGHLESAMEHYPKWLQGITSSRSLKYSTLWSLHLYKTDTVHLLCPYLWRLLYKHKVP